MCLWLAYLPTDTGCNGATRWCAFGEAALVNAREYNQTSKVHVASGVIRAQTVWP
jgi:hypothetical protein